MKFRLKYKKRMEEFKMKAKHILWIVGALAAVAALAAGVAVFVNRFLAEEDAENYVECEVAEDDE
jgi:flagellar basal body-associated protein FliL